jgi:tetratricopeptide (TPR) repeat protein
MGTSKAIPLLLAIVFAGHAASAQETAADPLREPERLIQAQKYAEAEAKLKELSASQARNSQLWFDLGYAQSHQGKAADAAASYQKAVDAAPKWFEANMNLGLTLATAGNFPAAVTALQHAVELKPAKGGAAEEAKAWLSLAEITERAQGDPKNALAAYDKAIALHPSGEAYFNSGKLLQKSGDMAGAEQRYIKAADLGESGAVIELANLMVQQKRLPEAETWLRKFVAANPQNPAARAQLGRVLAAEGKTQDAIDLLQPLAGAGADPSVDRELASLYTEAKQYDRAAPLLQQLVAKDPGDYQSHLDFGIALMHLQKYPEAEGELLRALKLKSDLVDAYAYLADAAQQNKHYELTIRVLDTRAKLAPETPFTYFLRATAYDSLRMPKQAIENYKRFLEVAGGKFPDQEFQARHRLKAIEH